MQIIPSRTEEDGGIPYMFLGEKEGKSSVDSPNGGIRK